MFTTHPFFGVTYKANKATGAGLAFQLQSRMRYVKLSRQSLIHRFHDFGAATYHLVINEQMGAQSVNARGDGPDMAIMDVPNA